MSAAAVPRLKTTPARYQKGFFIVRRGLPEAGASPSEVMWNHRDLMRHAGNPGYAVTMLIIETSQVPSANGYGSIFLEEDAATVNMTERGLRYVLARLMKRRLIEAHPTEPMRFRPLYENFSKGEAYGIRRRPGERIPPQRETGNVEGETARIAVPPPETRFTAAPPAPPPESPPERKPVSLESETDFRPRETYCPWKWECPHLVNGLAAGKKLKKLVNIETTQASKKVEVGDCLLPIEDLRYQEFAAWIRIQPWMTDAKKRGPGPEGFVHVLKDLDAAGATFGQFLVKTGFKLLPIAKDPIAVLRAAIRDAYPAAKRAGERLTPMRDIMPGDEGSGE